MSIPTYGIWLIVGAVLIVIETTLPGIGLLFVGLGAITVGSAMLLGWIETVGSQFILFFLSTGVWTALLWKPLKGFLRGKGSGFSDMVGSIAVVHGEALENEKTGHVKWSGAVMKCKLDPQSEGVEKIEAGTEVIISGVSKGILLIQTKSTN